MGRVENITSVYPIIKGENLARKKFAEIDLLIISYKGISRIFTTFYDMTTGSPSTYFS